MEAIYTLSMTSLEYTRDLYLVLEEIYQRMFHSTLTMDKLGEVITEPRAPGELLNHPRYGSRKVSEVLEQEISRLMRMRHIVNYVK